MSVRITRKRIAFLAALVTVIVAGGAAYALSPKGLVVKGTAHADKLYGKSGNDRLYGYAGNDLLVGGAGDDLLVGGPGADTLNCGPGRDTAIADKSDTIKGCEVVKGLPPPIPPPAGTPPSATPSGLYLAVGTSISAGSGASSEKKAWVSLFDGYLSSNGTGVTMLTNLATPGITSAGVVRSELPGAVAAIDDPASDTLRVTIDVGSNDIITLGACDHPNDPGCPFAGNLKVILGTLNAALARDPGDETVQILEYYNWKIGTPEEIANRIRLLGDDLKIDCSGTGRALGLNDIIHCTALSYGMVPIDVLPAFDVAGTAFLDADHLHPNDAGHLAIAKAFGGAA
jgi:lysophospholipase L1-like esterase